MAVTRLVAPGPLVPMHTPALPVARRVTFRGETAALFVARQNGADFGFGERLVDFHARAAGIGENDLDAFAFEGFDEDVAPEHGRADLGARGGGGFGFCFAVSVVLLMCSFGCGRLARVKQKTHGRCQPWVLVKLLRSTSANGVASYDDYQNDSLWDVFQHCGAEC